MSRLVVPGLAHHVTQRGVRSMDISTDDEDRKLYVDLMREQSARYAEMNPVRAGMVERPDQHPWSSARYHLGLIETDPLLTDMSVADAVDDWRAFLREAADAEDQGLEKRLRCGRPWASEALVTRLEKQTSRGLRTGKSGWPKGKPRGKKKR